MTPGTTTVEVRQLTAEAAEIAIGGDVTSASEGQLIDAYVRASADGGIFRLARDENIKPSAAAPTVLICLTVRRATVRALHNRPRSSTFIYLFVEF